MKCMKKWILLTVVMVLPLTMLAQDDDMYFVPTKENVAKEKKSWGMPADTYYSGSNRSVDDYNHYKMAPSDSVGNDIINFSAVRGVYPDSTYMDSSAASDYQYTRQLSRFDDYVVSEAYWEGYRDGRWSSPWYYTSYYPWYDSWYDPWYYDAYWSWHYRPWGWYRGYYSPWYRHHRPYYYGGRSYRPIRGRNSYSNSSFARTQRRSTAPTRRFGESGGIRSNNSGHRSFGGGGSSRSGGGSFSGGGGGGRSGGGGHSFGTRR